MLCLPNALSAYRFPSHYHSPFTPEAQSRYLSRLLDAYSVVTPLYVSKQRPAISDPTTSAMIAKRLVAVIVRPTLRMKCLVILSDKSITRLQNKP